MLRLQNSEKPKSDELVACKTTFITSGHRISAGVVSPLMTAGFVNKSLNDVAPRKCHSELPRSDVEEHGKASSLAGPLSTP